MKHSFKLLIHKRSTHWVSVHLHSSRRVMRGVLRRLGHDSTHTNAATWQPNKPQGDDCVAEVHFCRDHLSLANIAHEMAHAAYHRAIIIGIPKADETFQEYVAEDTGILTDACIAYFDRNKIAVQYQCVPARRCV